MRGTGLTVIAGVLALLFLTATGAWGEESRSTTSVDVLPQELQPSVRPSSQRVIPEGWYPVTHVRLPERMRRVGTEPEVRAWYSNFAQGGNDIFGSGMVTEAKPRVDVKADTAWFYNFAAGGNSVFSDTALPETQTGAWYDNFIVGGNDIFGDSFDAVQQDVLRSERKVDADVDGEGYLKFGAVVQSSCGYASMLLPDSYYEGNTVMEGDSVRLPKPFSFDSDDSPIILTEVTSPGPGPEEIYAMAPGRLYRSYDGGRRPAEIIERDPIKPRPLPGPRPRMGMDTPAMVPPAGGVIPRTVVKLPTSSQGLGMASGYYPGR